MGELQLNLAQLKHSWVNWTQIYFKIKGTMI